MGRKTTKEKGYTFVNQTDGRAYEVGFQATQERCTPRSTRSIMGIWVQPKQQTWQNSSSKGELGREANRLPASLFSAHFPVTERKRGWIPPRLTDWKDLGKLFTPHETPVRTACCWYFSAYFYRWLSKAVFAFPLGSPKGSGRRDVAPRCPG